MGSFKDALLTQVHRLQRIAAPLSIVLLSANLATTTFSLLAWRGIHPYWGISILTTTLLVLAIIAANIWTVRLRLHESERAAQMRHDPAQIYAFTPFQAAMVHLVHAPTLEALGQETRAKDLRSFADLGYIPRDSYPGSLRHHYPKNWRAL